MFKTSNLGSCILNGLVQLLQRGLQINHKVKRESQITLVNINFPPVIIFTDFHWASVHKLEYVNTIFISPSVWITITVDALVKWSKTEILELGLRFVMQLIYCTYLSHLNCLKISLKLERLASSCLVSLWFTVWWNYHTAN